MAPISPYSKIREDFQLSCWSFRLNTHQFSSVFNDLGDLGLHPQVKGRIPPGLLGNKIQKVPLRHQTKKFAMGGKVGEICNSDGFGPDLSRQLTYFLVRTFEKFVQNA